MAGRRHFSIECLQAEKQQQLFPPPSRSCDALYVVAILFVQLWVYLKSFKKNWAIERVIFLLNVSEFAN